MREKRRLLEEAQLKVEALEQRQSLERRLEEEEAEFHKRELEIAKEREQNKAEMARKIEKMQVEMELKKAAVDLEIEQEELQTERSDNETVSEIIPPLNPELIPHTPLRPFSLSQDTHLIPHPPSDVQTTRTKALKAEHEVSSVSAFSQSDMDPPYVPLPTPASQSKETRQKSSVRVDVDDFKPFVTKDEKSSPTDKFKSELQTPQRSHTQLEQVLLQTLQHLTQQPASQVPQPPSVELADKAPWQAIAEALKQGPTLPKIELMKFGGDPSEYGEFVANFRDHIESQVSDDSQRLTRLLAQCVGKA